MRAKSLKRWWPGTELNRRRQPFQGCALPPELPGHACTTDGLPGSDLAGSGMPRPSRITRNAGSVSDSHDYSNHHGFSQRHDVSAGRIERPIQHR